MARFLVLALACSASAFVAPTARLPSARRVHADAPPKKAAPMTMVSPATVIGTCFPTIGIATSNFLYASSLPAVLERVETGDLGELNPLPTAIVLFSTIAWVQYALSVKNPYVLVSNLPGTLAAVTAIANMLPLMRGNAGLKGVQTTLVAGALSNLALWSYLIFSGMGAAARTKILGLYASAFCIVLFGSPLSTISKVLKTRNSASILGAFTLAQVSNCALWAVYGLWAAKDVYVYGPNLCGLGLGLCQLALKVVFPSK